MIELARKLGRTADELGRSMSAAELTDQRALDMELAAERRRADERAAAAAEKRRR